MVGGRTNYVHLCTVRASVQDDAEVNLDELLDHVSSSPNVSSLLALCILMKLPFLLRLRHLCRS